MEAETLMRFVGRKKPYSKQASNGSYYKVDEEITIETLEKHLRGEHTLGSFVIREDGNITFAVIDIDIDKDNLEKNPDLLKSFEKLGRLIMDLFPEFDRCLEFSGRRGYHIWLFTEKPEKPAFMRELIKSRLRTKNIINIEVYPKQDTVCELNKQLGNLIKLPCGKHKKGGWSKIIKWVQNV